MTGSGTGSAPSGSDRGDHPGSDDAPTCANCSRPLSTKYDGFRARFCLDCMESYAIDEWENER